MWVPIVTRKVLDPTSIARLSLHVYACFSLRVHAVWRLYVCSDCPREKRWIQHLLLVFLYMYTLVWRLHVGTDCLREKF